MANLRRGIEPALEQAIQTVPVVILEGGRAVGKSTVCRELIARHDWPSLTDLSDPGVVDAIRIDPLRYLRNLPTPSFLDEAQLLPELPLWVKRVVDDRAGVPGQFVLTGSARLGRHQLGGSDPLAGRALRLRMWSMTPSEAADNPRAVSHLLFNDAEWESDSAASHVDEWDVRSWLHGGLPGIPGVLGPSDPNVWSRAMDAYVDAVIPLGVASPRTDHARLLRMFRYLAANPAQQLSFARVSDEFQIRAETARSYIEALEAAFLIFRVEAHRPSEHKVLTAHPRLHTTDIGLAVWASKVIEVMPPASTLGNLLENQLAHALAATLDWEPPKIELRHWRDQRSQIEVDLLLVHSDGRCIAIEVKSSITVGPESTLGIQAFAAANADRFHRGFVAYCGNRTIDLSPSQLPAGSILAVPMERLLR